jgi:NAD(P)-dependent dehydrogenase (short-subunit alcohol dehydrogenase family)
MKQSVAERPRASRGVIINIASRASLEGVPKFGSYCAVSSSKSCVPKDLAHFRDPQAKHAVLGISRVAAVGE